MADTHPNLNLTPEEKRAFYQLFQAADKTNLGVVTGEVAVSFFEKTSLSAETLGLIWQIADTQNRGLLTPSGFSVVLRLIGHAQAGRPPTEQLALEPGPLPKFTGISIDASPRPASTSPPPGAGGAGPVRVPPLNPEDIAKFSALFDKSDTSSGVISGEVAKQIFERARLPNEVLGRIWNLSDTKERGALDSTEFIIAMHLLTAHKMGTMRGVPQSLPQGLYDAAARHGNVRGSAGSRGSSDVPPVPAIPKQFSGQRTQSPLNRSQVASTIPAQTTGSDWLITPQEKTQFDSVFANVDKAKSGYINGDQAVGFFTNAQLAEETLAQIWDLADIDGDGQLSKDEFAVAMYLVRQQRTSREPLPQTLPPALTPPSMRQQPRVASPQQPVQQQPTGPRSASEDLFGLDVFSSASSQVPQSTGGSNQQTRPPASPPQQGPTQSTTFKPFVPTSSFGQSLAPQETGPAPPAQPRSPPQGVDDLLGDADPEESKKLTQDTSDLANLSNQVGALSKEMQSVQGKHAEGKQELEQTSQQKRDFESRLAQARTVYDQEVKAYKELEEQLATSRAETKKLQQEFAMVDANRQDLNTQHNQLSAQLEADKQENASLKEKISQTNAQVNHIKPQLEKMRSDSRQQKGLVAINKKQLATVEGERDRLQGETDTPPSKEPQEIEQQPTGSGTSSAPVTSPAASTGSQRTNPFFKRTQTAPSENAFSLPPANEEAPKDSQSVFDNMFGPAFSMPSTTSSPPPTTFRTESPAQSGEKTPVAAPQKEGLDIENSQTLPATTFSPSSEPPAPPQSRQITPSGLPISGHQASETSSMKASPPASRFGGSEANNSAARSQTVSGEQELKDDSSDGEPSHSLPGAFPTDPSPSEAQAKKDMSFEEVFGGRVHQRSQSQKALDFEEAFAAMKVKPGDGQQDPSKPNGAGAGVSGGEFPPIKELDDGADDSSSDEEAPTGFDDDFTPVSPTGKGGSSSQGGKGAGGAAFPFPSVEKTGDISSPASDPKSESSPPAAAKPTSPDTDTTQQAAGQGSSRTATATNSQKPDFDAAFAGLDLAPAKETDDDDDDDDDDDEEEFGSPFNNKDSSNFDMSFDPPASKPNDSSSNNTNNNDNKAQPGPLPPANPPSSHDWDALFSVLDKPKEGGEGDEAQKNSQPASSGETETETETGGQQGGGGGGGGGGVSPHSFPSPPTQDQQGKQPGWALSVDSGEDDQMLKRLTSMGYPRDESLAALEKFDYHIDKAADFLASKS